MKNAHERFGMVAFTKRVKDTTTQIRVYMDRLIAEPAKDDRGPMTAHLFSVLGSDAEIAALWAAVTEGAFFQIRIPSTPTFAAFLGPEAQCYRGSAIVPGRKRPVRHLVALSAEMLKARPGTDREGNRTVLCNDDPTFVLYRVARRFGLPVVPEWAPWFNKEANTERDSEPARPHRSQRWLQKFHHRLARQDSPRPPNWHGRSTGSLRRRPAARPVGRSIPTPSRQENSAGLRSRFALSFGTLECSSEQRSAEIDHRCARLPAAFGPYRVEPLH